MTSNCQPDDVAPERYNPVAGAGRKTVAAIVQLLVSQPDTAVVQKVVVVTKAAVAAVPGKSINGGGGGGKGSSDKGGGGGGAASSDIKPASQAGAPAKVVYKNAEEARMAKIAIAKAKREAKDFLATKGGTVVL